MKTQRARLMGLLMATTALAAAPWPAAAQAGSATQIQETREFDIAPQPLGSALAQFSQQSGLQVTVAGELARTQTAPAVRGRITSAEALRRLLAGSGLAYSVEGGTVTLAQAAPQTSSAPAPGATKLGPIQVEGNAAQDAADRQNPNGPSVGYVATRSATGTKTNTALIDTPQSISVVTRQQMDDQNIQSVPEALRYSPGVLPEQHGVSESGVEYISGRGFLIDSFLDGLRLPSGNTGTTGYNVASVDPYFLQSIQVLHGPASVLYGQASPGGVVNLVSKQPTADPVHEISLQTGSYGRAQGSADFGGALDDGQTLLYRLTANAYDSGTQVDHVHTQRIAIEPSFTWRPDADTSLTVIVNYQNDPEAGFYNFVPAQGTVLPNAAGKISRSFDPGDPDYDHHRRTQASIGYQFERRLNDVLTVRQGLRYLTIDDDFLNAFGFGVSAANPAVMNRYAFINEEGLHNLTLDNQLQADLSTGPVRHTLLVGVDYAHTMGTEAYGLGAAPALNIFSPSYGAAIAVPAYSGIERFTQDRVGLYAQEQLTIDRLHILIGGRQDWYDARDHEQIADTLQTQSDRPFTWRAGAVYEFEDGLAPYFSYATSFQPDESSSYSGQLLAPNTAQQYEAGLKYQSPGQSSFVTAALFHLTEQNVATTDPDHPTFSIATGEIRAQGVELEGHADLSQALQLVASYTYLDSLVTKSNTTNLDKVPTAIPKNMASLWGTYRFTSDLPQGLQLGAGIRYVGSSWGTATNDFKVPSYTLVDAEAQYDLERLSSSLAHWQTSINATNLFDKRYVASCTALTNCNFGLGRMVLAKISYRW